MNSKKTKITVDILMTISLTLSFIRWDNSNFAFHAAVGLLCALFFAMHVLIHRKWLRATTKSCLSGKLNKGLKWKYVINILLLAFWGVSIATGFIAIVPFMGDSEGVSTLGRLHGITARIGLGLVVIHIIQHLPQIKLYIGIKKAGEK